MGIDEKQRVRDEVERGGWTIIWVGAKMPCAFLNEEVELMFENMDGYACVCDAIYTCERQIIGYTPFFKRKSDGARMVNCIAFRKHKENKENAENR